MKILVVHNRYRPGVPSGENSVVDAESAELVSRGHQVAHFERHSGDIATWSLARRATLPLRLLWSTEARRALETEIDRFAPDVVHLHNTFPLITPSVLSACRDRGVPVVATLHNYKLGCASGEFFRAGAVCHDCLDGSRTAAVRHGCYRGSRLTTVPVVAAQTLHARAWRTSVSAYVFISAAQQQVLAPLGLPPDRCFVKHNFVPERQASAPAQEAAHEVVHLGRLDPAKGADVLMLAWDAFRAMRPDARLRLVVVGSGPLEDAVRAWAAGKDHVSHLGHVPREQVPRALARARAAVLPSRWEETFGLVAVEAMAVGTAPLATAHGAFPEIITDGVDGALVPPSDPRALARAFCQIDDHPDRWAAFGRAGRETYRRRFTPEAVMDRLVNIYRFAVDHPVTAPASPDRGDPDRSRTFP